MTIIKRKTFIIKYFARFAEQTDLQKKTKYCDVEKPLNFDPFGHARFAHLFVLYD